MLSVRTKYNLFYYKLSKYIRNETNPPDKLPEIEQAVAENNFQQFKQLLDSHPNLIQRSQAQHGNRLLMAAVKNQANPMLKKLLQHGADPRLTDPEGRTPLHWAANKKLLAITQTLLNDHRTQLACLDKWGNSVLWQAGIQGHPAIIQKFLEDPQRGFEANPQLGQDELYRALTAPHWRAMESFLDGGVDPDQINATGKSVWQEAAQNPNPQIMQLLLRYDRLELQDRLWWAFKQKDCPFFQQLLQHEGISLEQANPQGLVLLLVAVKNGDLDSVGQLLQANANPRCVDPQDRSALALAILSDKPQRLQIANRLLQQDASLIEQADHQGRTPLLLAAERGDQPMVDWLLQAGANSQQRDHQGKSALSLAVLSSNKQQCGPVAQQLYQENGCLINQADNKQQTPLILAAKQVFLPMIQWLLSVQADSTARDHLGRNALVVAAQSQHDSAPEMIQLLSENAFSQFDALDWAVEHDHAAVDRLIEQGIAIDQVDRHGQTLLLAAAYHGKLDAINKLLNYYPRNSLNQTNRKDQTALSYAAQRGHLDSVQALLRAGADLNLSDQQGYTPLLWALDKGHDQIALWLLQQNAELSVTCPSTGTIKSALIIAIKKNRISLINPLIEHGADLNAVDDQGFTPLYWAARLGSVASLEILLQQSTIVK